MFLQISQESSVFRIKEGPSPRTNILAVKHLDLHKGQPAKRELGPPQRAGLGKMPRLGKGPQGETWLCSESATRASPSAWGWGGGWEWGVRLPKRRRAAACGWAGSFPSPHQPQSHQVGVSNEPTTQ